MKYTPPFCQILLCCIDIDVMKLMVQTFQVFEDIRLKKNESGYYFTGLFFGGGHESRIWGRAFLGVWAGFPFAEKMVMPDRARLCGGVVELSGENQERAKTCSC